MPDNEKIREQGSQGEPIDFEAWVADVNARLAAIEQYLTMAPTRSLAERRRMAGMPLLRRRESD